jgi:hypothetical protein
LPISYCNGSNCINITLLYPPSNVSINGLTFNISYYVVTVNNTKANCTLSVDSFIRETAELDNNTLHNYLYATYSNATHQLMINCIDTPYTGTLGANFTIDYTGVSNLGYENIFTELISNFFNSYISYIIGILIFALSYFFGKTLSQITLIAAVGFFAAFIMFSTVPIFIYGAIFLLILGFVMKYTGM